VKTVTLTISQTIVASQVLAQLMRVKRPMMSTMKMRRVVRSVNAQLGDYDTQRQELLDLHGAKDENGRRKEENGQVVFADDAAKAAFAHDVGELLLVTWTPPEVLAVKDFGPLTPDGSDWLHEEQAPTPEQTFALGGLLEDLTPEKSAPPKTDG
jgi:hypothetical protein